jgi:hypothetical protein
MREFGRLIEKMIKYSYSINNSNRINMTGINETA